MIFLGNVCHHSQLFRCCEVDNILGEPRNIVEGGGSVDLGGTTVTVSFFYAGGGYGSREPLSKWHFGIFDMIASSNNNHNLAAKFLFTVKAAETSITFGCIMLGSLQFYAQQ